MGELPIPIDELRPLVHQPPRRREGKLVFESPLREVAIEGDVGFVGDVIGCCNGERTVAEIAAELDADSEEVRELIDSLVDQELISDCTRAWRNFHRQSSISSGMFRHVEEAELESLMAERFTPRHEDGFHALRPEGGALDELAARRGSTWAGRGARGPTFGELSSLLALMYGRPQESARPVPSGGGIYALALHVLVRHPLEPLEAGLWWYEPERGGLWMVRDRDLDADQLFLSHPTTDPLISYGHPIIFISADLERVSRKYANRAYRLALIEIGAVMQNAYLMGAQREIPVRAVAGIVEERLDAFLELPNSAHALLAILVGN